MTKAGNYELDGLDLYAHFGWFSRERSSSDDLLRYPKGKEVTYHDWQDGNGKEYDLSARYFEDGTITLAGSMEAYSEDEFWRKYYTLRAALTAPGERILYVDELGKSFRVFYREVTKSNRRTRLKDVSYICWDLNIQFTVISEFSLHRPIAFFNTQLNVGQVSVNGTAMKGLAGVKLNFNTPFPDGDSLPALMTVLSGSVQVAAITFKKQALGQACSLDYNGSIYQLTFQNGNVNL